MIKLLKKQRKSNAHPDISKIVKKELHFIVENIFLNAKCKYEVSDQELLELILNFL